MYSLKFYQSEVSSMEGKENKPTLDQVTKTFSIHSLLLDKFIEIPLA